jgi:hypothetical protein
MSMVKHMMPALVITEITEVICGKRSAEGRVGRREVHLEDRHPGADVLSSGGEGAAEGVDELPAVCADLHDVADVGEERRQRKGCHEERDVAVLDGELGVVLQSAHERVVRLQRELQLRLGDIAFAGQAESLLFWRLIGELLRVLAALPPRHRQWQQHLLGVADEESRACERSEWRRRREDEDRR